MTYKRCDEISESRKFAIAKRCQLIIGSFENSPYNCPCAAVWFCKLADSERRELSENPDIINAIDKNKIECELQIRECT